MFDLIALIKAAGYFGIFGIIFAESGLLIGAFLPGDSLLFMAGFLASQEYLSIVSLVLISFAGAVLGDGVGYWLGRKFGPKIFMRKDSLWFSSDHVLRAEIFYRKYGGRAIMLARFVPIGRTLAPIIAGVGGMHYPTFLFYNVLGGALWAIGIPLTGFYLGSVIPNVDRYMIPIVAGIVIASVLPGLVHFFKNGENRRRFVTLIRNRIFRRG